MKFERAGYVIHLFDEFSHPTDIMFLIIRVSYSVPN